MTSLPATFWSKVDTSGGCWLWTAGKTLDGYGTFNSPRPFRTNLAHRLAFIDSSGVIPEGMTLDHLCGVKNCVRVDHLEVVTRQVNIQRAWAARRTASLVEHFETNRRTA